MDEEHVQAWEDIPRKEWAHRATQAIELLEEAGFLLAQQALENYDGNNGIIEVHASYPNTARVSTFNTDFLQITSEKIYVKN